MKKDYFDSKALYEMMSSINEDQGLINEAFAVFLVKTFEQYKKEDLFMACFCICSWRYNRPHLPFYLTINHDLIHTNKFGEKRIDSYKAFEEFLVTIAEKYDTKYDDDIISDFGEIKIPFNNKYHSVFVGTGHNFLLPFYFSLETIAKKLEIVKEISDCLEYVNKMVEMYGVIEQFDESLYDATTISIPDEKYFEECKKKYNYEELKEDSALLNFTSEKQRSAITTHFVLCDEMYYPLFNPSLVIDAFNLFSLKKELSQEMFINMANSIINNALRDNFEKNQTPNILLKNPFFEDSNEGKVIGKKPLNYAICHNDKLLILINELEFTSEEFDMLFNRVHDLKAQNHLRLIVPDRYPRCRLYEVSNKQIEIIVYDSIFFLGGGALINEDNQINKHMYLYDLISMIYQAKTVGDFVDFFFKNSRVLHSSNPYAGVSALFDAWQKQNKEFSQGASEIHNVMTDVYAVEWDVFNKYIEYGEWFPFDNYSEMFSNPFSWNIEGEENGFKRLKSKSVFGFYGAFKKIKDAGVFLAFNMEFENFENPLNQRREIINLAEDLTEKLIQHFEDLVYNCIFKQIKDLQIIYMPNEYAKEIDDTGFTKEDRKFVLSDHYFHDNKMVIRFTINEDELLDGILKASNKEVECLFFKELFQCLQGDKRFDFAFLENEIMKHASEKKEVEATSFEINYLFSNSNLGGWPNDDSFIKVRKDIAIACKQKGIKPGIYTAKEATSVVRRIQEEIIPRFEMELSKYDKYDLHKRLLSINSYNYHQKRIEDRRYGMINSNWLSDSEKYSFGEKTIEARERLKHQIRTINYIIDTNLAIEHNVDQCAKDLYYILAYANWLIVLQDCSDECHYELFDIKIKIEDDYRVNTVYSADYERLSNARNKRIYDNRDYEPRVENVAERFEESLQAFYEDTGVDLPTVIQTCDYLSKEFSATFNESIMPDVYEIGYNDLLNDYISILKEKDDSNIIKVRKALEYLIIDEEKIKTIAGKREQFVPIWEREKRDYRFDIRPIVKSGDYLIFSPVVMYELEMIWRFGSTQFFPPYEFGLTKYLKCLAKWKSDCEKQMEKDLEELFKLKGYIVRRSFELKDVDKGYGHPVELGDYDVIAVDENNKVLWNIESKFLGKVGSIKEYYFHQNSFFNVDKKDEKYARRIEYLEKNTDRILTVLGIKDRSGYSINNYMVTNKVYESDLKEISFNIVTYYELSSMLAYR